MLCITSNVKSKHEKTHKTLIRELYYESEAASHQLFEMYTRINIDIKHRFSVVKSKFLSAAFRPKHGATKIQYSEKKNPYPK